jgi:hypothetical protein
MAENAAKKTSATEKPEKARDAGQAEVQARSDEATKKGYFGNTPDNTPNENYTLAGVIADKPTPENQRGKK